MNPRSEQTTAASSPPSSPEFRDSRRRLREAGLRCTPQRLAILEALNHASHPTADQLHAMVSKELPLSLATVYNTLDAFSNAGLILRVPAPSGSCHFCGREAAHLHLHLGDGDDIVDVPEDLGNRIMEALPMDILAEIESRLDVSIDGIDLRLSGRRQAGPSA